MPKKSAIPRLIWNAFVKLRRSPGDLRHIAKTARLTPERLRALDVKYKECKSFKQYQGEAHPDNRYIRIMRGLFTKSRRRQGKGFEWRRAELTTIAARLGIKVPRNIGDNIYAIRHGRMLLPPEIANLAPPGKCWLLLPNGKSAYKFVPGARTFLVPNFRKIPIKIPDSTPQIVARYAKKDEQAVLARIRYCRLVDIFLSLASFQLQSHMRTSIVAFKGAQAELDEIYVGVDGNGAQYVIPIQAKGKKDSIGAVQVITDAAAVAEKFSPLIARTLVAKLIDVECLSDGFESYTIALIEASVARGVNVRKIREEHFKLVPAALIKDSDLAAYAKHRRPPKVN